MLLHILVHRYHYTNLPGFFNSVHAVRVRLLYYKNHSSQTLHICHHQQQDVNCQMFVRAKGLLCTARVIKSGLPARLVSGHVVS